MSTSKFNDVKKWKRSTPTRSKSSLDARDTTISASCRSRASVRGIVARNCSFSAELTSISPMPSAHALSGSHIAKGTIKANATRRHLLRIIGKTLLISSLEKRMLCKSRCRLLRKSLCPFFSSLTTSTGSIVHTPDRLINVAETQPTSCWTALYPAKDTPDCPPVVGSRSNFQAESKTTGPG